MTSLNTTRWLLTSVVMFLLLLSPLATAQLIEADAFADGDNKAFTLDLPRYNLIWLDASQVLNLDKDEIQSLLNDGLANAGWRLANYSEAQKIFSFLYSERYETDPSREFPFICLSSCTNVFSDSENGLIWPTYQEIIGFEALADEQFIHTFFTSTRGYEYYPFELALNLFAPGQDFAENPQWSYDDFYYHSYASDHPGILRNYYQVPDLTNYPNPFSFLLVASRDGEDTPVPEPTSALLFLFAGFLYFRKLKQ
ncbi:PEP-CTERM sorting domain-containing protein [Thalassotalea litorea]|uniref:PEP-CTERM sorting domain-containing protein n=1 Tax=Thalassotalea litorea TaxID=2020715 RepID=UPI003736DA2E